MEYSIRYSTRRKGIRITVERDRSVIVTVPEATSAEFIEQVVDQQRVKIQQRINHPQKYPDPQPISEFVSGESILFLGRTYPLTITDGASESFRFDDHFYISKASQAEANTLLRAWYQQQAHTWLTPKIGQYAERLGVAYTGIQITDLKYRWGSCTALSKLRFNWRLIKDPMRVVESIIVHELAHLLEPNHTPAFWHIIAIQLPHYEKAKGWLKEHGHLLEVDF